MSKYQRLPEDANPEADQAESSAERKESLELNQNERMKKINHTDTSEDNSNESGVSEARNSHLKKSDSLKQAKRQSPFQYNEDNKSEEQSFAYQSSGSKNQQEQQYSDDNRGSGAERFTNSSNLRSTLPLSPFYGKFIESLRGRRMRNVKQDLHNHRAMFYQPIDEMNKTALHIACEK